MGCPRPKAGATLDSQPSYIVADAADAANAAGLAKSSLWVTCVVKRSAD
jgi:hypothetical protein